MFSAALTLGLRGPKPHIETIVPPLAKSRTAEPTAPESRGESKTGIVASAKPRWTRYGFDVKPITFTTANAYGLPVGTYAPHPLLIAFQIDGQRLPGFPKSEAIFALALDQVRWQPHLDAGRLSVIVDQDDPEWGFLGYQSELSPHWGRSARLDNGMFVKRMNERNYPVVALVHPKQGIVVASEHGIGFDGSSFYEIREPRFTIDGLTPCEAEEAFLLSQLGRMKFGSAGGTNSYPSASERAARLGIDSVEVTCQGWEFLSSVVRFEDGRTVTIPGEVLANLDKSPKAPEVDRIGAVALAGFTERQNKEVQFLLRTAKKFADDHDTSDGVWVDVGTNEAKRMGIANLKALIFHNVVTSYTVEMTGGDSRTERGCAL